MNANRLGVAVAVMLAGTLPALADTKPGSAELPVTRIVLFTSGVGYFQRDGQVDGNARIDLSFHTQKINDLLKSLVLQDRDGGRISTVNYDNRDPIDKTLKSFAIDLTRNPSLGQLLDQVRGEQVEAISYGEMGNQGRPTTLTGIIVGVEKHKKPAGKDKDQVVETEQLNLLTSEGIRAVPLDQLERLRLLKPEIEQEFRRALEVLATGHDKQKKTVSLNFLGNGKRNVRVGYVMESPMWKTSYRLAVDKEEKNTKAFLQGWGIVENTSDEDWNHVRLGLISGRPISFQMDLYEPLYVPRPVVEPELFASLRPPAYSGNIEEQRQAAMQQQRRRALNGDRYERDKMPAMKSAPMAAGGIAAPPRGEGGERGGRDGQLNFQQGVASAAVATELGEYFKYEIEQPVSLARQKSALIPIVNGPVEAAKVSIYNEAVQAKFPLLGLRFKNTTGLHLMQGPVTVFEGNTYAGDARVGDLQPNESRLISYAVDLGTEVVPEVPKPADDLVSIKIYKGILHATHKVRHRKLYTIKNRSEHERQVLIEYPYHAAMKLVTPEKPAERTRDVYRFELPAEPNKPVKLEVVEEEQRVDQIALTNSDDQTIRFFIRSNIIIPKAKEALEQALKLKNQWEATQREISREEQELQKIVADQTRMRENMKAIPSTSDAYRRYLKKFDTQETDIEQRREKVAKLQETAEAQRREYETFLLNLNVE
jgi:hypothetical protein